jgi:F0F1-type ATP synthase assembly protein I
MEKKVIASKGTYSSGPQQQFITSAVSMSWQLAIVFLLPVIAGIELDKHLKSSPVCTLIGLVVAIAAAAIVVWRSVKGVNAMVAAAAEQKKP